MPRGINEITFTEKKATRDGFGAGFYEVAKDNPEIIALCADLVGSLKIQPFINDFPERFIQVGIACLLYTSDAADE